jgi:hypothetical protein
MSSSDIGSSGHLLDDPDVAERTKDRRFSRSASSSGPVYSFNVGALFWSCYDAFDEEEGLEVHWHKIHLEDRTEGGSCTSDGAPDMFIDAVLRLLQAWKHHKHELLLECAPLGIGKL